MKKIAIIICLTFCFYSCKSSKQAKNTSRNHTSVTTRPSKTSINTNDSNGKITSDPNISKARHRDGNSKIAEDIIDYAEKFEGVRYKYGGTTKKGMDCSGLVTTAFNSEGISLPRSSSQIALSGDWIDLKEVQKGDLLFFATNKKSRAVNHVALVVDVNGDQVQFIHSTTSAGVITSYLEERYWYYAFVQARRIL